MSKRRHPAQSRQQQAQQARRQRGLSRPLTWLLSAASANALAAGEHKIDAVANFTTVNQTGANKQQVVNNYQSGGVAVNVFNHFVVGNGNTVDLLVPGGSSQLVNIVRDSRPEVWGTLNSWQNGALGGNVVFASSQGFLVGSSGIVNVGKLTLRTPSQSDIDGFIDGTKAIADLASGTYTRSGSGLVTIAGKVNTSAGLTVDADQLVVSGTVIAGNAYGATYGAAVNTGDLTAPTELKADGGVISIVAKGGAGTAVDISGKLLADGGITIEAPTVTLSSTSLLDARRTGAAAATGDVTLSASAEEKLGYGQARATTSLTLAGEIQARNLSAKADSFAKSSYTEDWGDWIGMTTIGAVAGLSGYAVMADAGATVTVDGTAKLNAGGTLVLGSVARATAEDPAITLNGNSLIGAAVVYGEAKSTSQTVIKNGATVTAGGKLSVTAHNETHLDVSALTLVATNDNKAVAAVAVGDGSTHSKAQIETGAKLTAGSLSLHADNQNSFYVGASAYGLAGTALGVSVALGDFTTSAIADLGASLGSANAKTGAVDVVALDRTTEQRVHSSSTVGASLLMRTVGAPLVTAIGATQTAVNNLVRSVLPGSALNDVAKEADGTLSFRVGAAFSLAQSDHEAVAHIGNNVGGSTAPSIHSSDQVVVGARTDIREMRTTAESSVSARTAQGTGTQRDPEVENSGSIAINLTLGSGRAIAEIGDYTTIDALRIGVAAQQLQPLVSTYDRWSSLSDYIDHLNASAGLGNSLLSSYANASGEAEEKSIAGSFNYQSLAHDTKAWVGTRAKLSSSAADGAWSYGQTLAGRTVFSDVGYTFAFGAPIDIAAYNQAQSLDIAGNVGAFLILAGGGAGEDGKSLGASLSLVNYAANTIAGIGAGATVNAGAGGVAVDAQSDDAHIVITPTSGVGSGLAFNGIVGVLTMDNQTRASISNSAAVTGGKVNVEAEQHAGNWAAAGSFAYTDSKAVGIAVAVNIAEGETRATIGDNSADAALVQRDGVAATTASGTAPTAGVTTDALTVRATTDGTSGAIAAAGTATSPKTGEPGIGQQFENKWSALEAKAKAKFGMASGSSGSSSAGGASKSGASGDAAGGGDSVAQDTGFGLAASGSLTVLDSDLDSRATVTGATITARTTRSAIDVQALEKTVQVSAAGSAAFVQAGKQPGANSTTAFSGAVAYMISHDDAEATVVDTQALKAGTVNVNADQGGERLGLGLGFSVNTNDASGKNYSVGASASIAEVKDSASARVEGSELDAVSSTDTLSVGAYKRTDIGIGGGSLFGGGKGGVGLAITYADIGNGERDSAEARVTSTKLADFGTIALTARDASRIAAGAAGLGGGPDASGFAGSFVISEVGNARTATLSGGSVAGAGTLKVEVLDGVDAARDAKLDALGSGSENAQFDFAGSVLSDGSQGAFGARVLGVAGFLQVGKNNLGISYVHNDVARTSAAAITGGAEVNASNITVNAEDSSWMTAVAAGFGVATGSLSGVGSVAVNEVNNVLAASIGQWDAVSASGYVAGNHLKVGATNRAEIAAAAGSVALSKGASGGLAVALNLVGTDEHATRARVGWTDLVVASGELDIAAQSGTEGNPNSIYAVGVGVGLSKGFAFAGAIGVNSVEQSVDAGIKAVSTTRGGTTYRPDVTVTALDHTDSQAYGFMAAGAQSTGAAAVGISTNRIASDVTAEALGGGRGATLSVSDLTLDAKRDTQLITVDAGVAGSSGLAGAASIGTNVGSGKVLAQINAASVDANDNIKVAALSDTFSAVGGGAVGVGTGAGAGALAVSTAVDLGKTEALVENSTVTARGNSGQLSIRDGKLADSPSAPDLSNAGSSVDRDALSTSFADQTLREGAETVTGLAVSATSYEKLRTINVAGAGTTGAVAISVNTSTNDFEGSTRATIRNSTLNANASSSTGADVTVRASDHSMGLAISVGLAGANTGAGVAGVAMNLQTHDVGATVEGSTITADAMKLDARSTQMAQAVSAGGSGGGTGAGAASVVVTTQYGDVRAQLLGGTTTARQLAVDAAREQQSDVAAGAVGGAGQVGVGFGLAVTRSGGETEAVIGRDPDDDNATTTTKVNADGVTVDAARIATINSYTFGAGIGIGAVGVAGMINISDAGGETRAGLYDATLRAKDGTSASTLLDVNAQEVYTARQAAAGVGIGMVGIGASFNVVLAQSQTVAELVGSDVKATKTEVTAEADRKGEVYSIAAGAGKFAGAVSLGFIKFGAGDAGQADGELTASAAAATTTVNGSHASSNTQLTAAEQAQLDHRSGGLSLAVQNGALDASATVTGDGQSLQLGSASLLAARVSGGKLETDALNVTTDGRTHMYTLSGAAQGSIAGISGGLGITREYLLNSATVDTQLTAKGVNVAAVERDGAGGAAGEIEAFSAGAGGLVIGVAYSDVLVENRVVGGVTRATGSGTGNLLVSAKDLTSVKVGGDNENSPENVSVGLGVIGASVSRAEKNSDVDVWVGKNGSTLSGFDAISATGLVSGQVRATGFAVSAGVIDVMGVSSTAEDNSSVDAQLIGGVNTGTDGTVAITAQAVPETYARAYGVAVAAGAAVGGSFAYATANTAVTAAIASNAIFAGSGSVAVNALSGPSETAARGSYFSADAMALAASGGLLAGIAATEVEARHKGSTTAKLGDAVTLPTGDLSLAADSWSGQRADGDAYFGGAILGIGSNRAAAESATSTRVLVGKNPVAGVSRAGDLTLSATSTDRNEAFATGGGGGIISGSAATAETQAKDSDGAAAAAVEFADWSHGGTVGTGGLKVRATHDTLFFGGADTTAVSVVGASAANSTTTIDLDAKVVLGKNVAFEAQAIDIAALNAIDQIANPSLAGWNASVHAGAGGGINGYAAGSTINIDNQGARIALGDQAKLTVFALTAHEQLGNRLRLDAYSTLALDDQALLTTGGAIQNAATGSVITAVASNEIALGSGVKLENKVDRIELGTYSDVNVWSAANTKTYAAVGGASGESTVDVTVNNKVTLGAGSALTGYGSVGVYAGRSADAITDNQVLLNAISDVYNWTAAPISTSVTADATATVNNDIRIGSGAAISSVRNVWLQADEGRVYATGTGRGHNPYLELFSSETKSGSGKTASTSTVTFEGTASIEAGTRHDQSVAISANGTVTKGAGTEATTRDLANFSSRDSLQSYIDQLTAERKVVDDHVATLSAAEQASYAYSAAYQQIVSELAFLTPLLAELPSTPVSAVYVGGITAAGGDVHLAADKVAVNAGAPTITAHGDPTITITNSSGKALIVDTLTIPNDAGGQVLVTGGAANSLPAALKLSQSTGGSGSKVTITHKPTSASADLFIQGDITNLGGTVEVDVQQGNLLQTANISAKQMDISVSDIYLVNMSGLQSYGFAPQALSAYASSGRGWKPASAREAVMWYIADRYEGEIRDRGIAGFNSWFYGTDYANYAKDATVTSNIYLNWGFNNNAECSSNCTTFTFPNHAGGNERGNGNWKFDSVGDYTGKLLMSADYSQVKGSGVLGDAVTKDALNASLIAINAGTIDINGTIRAGNFNNWSVDIADRFDAAMATYVAKTGLKAGDKVTITPGQPLYYYDLVTSNCGIPVFCKPRNQRVTLDTGVSLMSGGDAGIALTYEVGTGKLTLDDVKANGSGTVLLRGKIVSTGADGRILVDDGLGTIRVNNQSGSALTVGSVDAGTQTTGLIRITDLNYSNRSDWFVHEPGRLVTHYVTNGTAQSYSGATGATVGAWEDGKATTTYQPKLGQWYTWTESARVQRSWDAPVDGWYSKYLPVGDWKFSNQDQPWTVGSGSITTSCGSCGGNYLTSVFTAGQMQRGFTGVDYTYDNYYGTTFTERNWQYSIPYDLQMSVKYYVKADHPIKMQFVGASQGSVDIASKQDLTLKGTISNSQGATSIQSDGAIAVGAGAAINSASLTLAAGGDIGSADRALGAIASRINASGGGLVNLDLTAQNQSIALERIAAGGDLTVAVDKTLTPSGSGTHLTGRNVQLTSSFGGFGDVDANQALNISVGGTLSVAARGDIHLRQASGDLHLKTLVSEGGDVGLTLDDGRLLNAIDSGGRSAAETAYLASLWSTLNMTGADAGKETVKAFENQVAARYQQYHLIKQRLSNAGDAGFAIDAAYLDAMRTRVAAQRGVAPASLSDAAVTAAIKSEYRAIEQFFDDQFGASQPFDRNAAFQSGWRYAVATDSALYASLTSGAQWKQSQLEIAISSAALTPVTNGYISDRAANIEGNNVGLKIGRGSVGEDAASRNIAISRTNPVISDSDKAVLVSAGPGDLAMTTTATQILATVKQQDPVKVNAGGHLTVTARDAIYIESDDALALKGVVSTGGDIRLSAGGAITNAAGNATTIRGGGLNIATTQGGIGSAELPLTLALRDALRVASAPGDIWLEHRGGGLALGSIGAGGFLGITAGGALTNWASNGAGYHIVADGARLVAVAGDQRFDLGTDGRAIGLHLSGGELALDGRNGYLEVSSSGGGALGDMALRGDLALKASGDLGIAGALSAANVRVTGDARLTGSAGAAWTSAGALSVLGGELALAPVALKGADATLSASAGSLQVGRLDAAGRVALLATDAVEVRGAVVAGQGLQADGQRVAVDAGASLRVTGDATLTAIDGIALRNVAASGRLAAISDAISIEGEVKAASAALTARTRLGFDAAGRLATTGAVVIDAASTAMAAGSGIEAGTALSLKGVGDHELGALRAATLSADVGGALGFGGALEVDGDAALKAGGAVAMKSVVAVGGKLTSASGSFAAEAAGTLKTGGDASITTTVGNIDLAKADIGGALALKSSKDVSLNGEVSAKSAGIDAVAAVAVNSATKVAEDVSLKAGGAVAVKGAVDVGGKLASESSMFAADAAGAVKTGGDASITTTVGNIDLAKADIGGALTLKSNKDVSLNGEVSAKSAGIDAVAVVTVNAATNVADDLSLKAGGAVAVKGAVDVGGKLTSESSMFVAEAAGAVKTGGDASITTTVGNIYLAKADIGGALTLKSNKDVSLDGAVGAKSLGIDAADSVAFNAATKVVEDVSLKAGGAVALNAALDIGGKLVSESSMFVAEAAGTVKSGGDASITTTVGSIDLATAEIGGALALKSNKDVALNGTVGAKSLDIDAVDGVTVNAQVTIAGDVALKANGTVALKGAVEVGGKLTSESSVFGAEAAGVVKTGGDASITTTAGSLDLAKADIGGALALKSNKDVSLNGTVGAKSLNIDAVGAVAVNAATNVADDVALKAGGAVALNAALGIGGKLASESASFAADAAGTVKTGGDASIATTIGSIDLAKADIGGALTLKSNEDVSLNGEVSAKSAGIDAVAAVTVNAATNVADDLSLKAGGAVALNAALGIGGKLASESASFAADAAGTLKTGDDASITTTVGNIDLAKADIGGELALKSNKDVSLNGTVGAKSLDIDAVDGVTVNAQVTIAGDVALNASGTVALKGAVDVGGKLTSESSVFGAEAAGTVKTGGDASITTTAGNIDLAKAEIGGALTLKSNKDVSLNGKVDAKSVGIDAVAAVAVNSATKVAEDVSLKAGGAVAVKGAVDVGGKLTSDSSMFAAQAAGAVKTGGDASITTTVGNIDLAKADIGGALTLKSNKDVSLDGAVGAKSLGIDAADSVAFNAATKVVEDVSLKAGAAVALNAALDIGGKLVSESSMFVAEAAGTVKSGGDASITTTVGSIDLATAEIGGALALKSNKDVSLNGTVGAKSLDIDAVDGVAVNAPVTIAGDVALKASGTVALNASLDIGGKLVSESSMFAAQAAGVVKTDGDASITTTVGNIYLAKADIGGALALKSNEDVALNGTVDAKSVGIDAVGAVAVNAAMNVADDLSLKAGGAVGLNGAVDAGGKLASESSVFAAQAAGVVKTGGDASITTTAGNIDLAKAEIGGALALKSNKDVALNGAVGAKSLDIDAVDGVTVNAPVTIAGDAALKAGGAAALKAALDVGGKLASESASFTADAAGMLKSGADTSIATTVGSVELAKTAVGGALMLKSNEDVALNGELRVAQGMAVEAADAIALNAGAQVGADATLKTGGAVTLQAGQTVEVGGALALEAGRFVAGSASRLKVGGDAAIKTAGGNIELATTEIAKQLVLQSRLDLKIGEDLLVGRSVSIDVAGKVLQAGRLHAGGAVNAQAGHWLMAGEAKLDAGGALSLRTAGQQNLAQLASGAGLTLDAGESIGLNGAWQVAGDATLRAVESIRIAPMGRGEIAGALNSRSGSLDMASGSRLLTGGDATIATAGKLTAARIEAGGLLSLDAGGDLRLTDLVKSGKGLSLAARGTIAFDGSVQTAGDLSLAGGTEIVIGAGRSLEVEGTLVASADAIELQSGSRLETGGDAMLTARRGDLTLAAARIGGDATLKASGAVALKERIEVGGELASESAVFAGGFRVGGDASVSTTSDSIELARAEVGGALTLKSNRDVSLHGDVDAKSIGIDAVAAVTIDAAAKVAGDASLKAGGAIALKGAVDVGGKLASSSSLFAAEAAGVVRTGGDASITTTAGNIDLAKAEIGGALALKSNRDVSLHGDVVAKSLGIDAAAAVAIDAAAKVAGDASLQAGGAIALKGAVDAGGRLTSESSMFAAEAAVKTGGDALIATTTSNIDLAKADIGGALTLKSSKDVSLNGEIGAKSLGIDAADSLAFNAATKVVEDVLLKAGGAVAVTGALDVGGKLASESSMFAAQAAVKTGGDASITTTAGNIDLAKAEIGGALALKSNKDVSLHGEVAARSIGIDAADAVAINATTRAAGELSIKAGGAVALKSAVEVGSKLTSESSMFAAQATGTVRTGGDASITTTVGNIDLAKADIDGALTLKSNKDVSLNGEVDAKSLGVDAVGAVAVNAATNVADDLALRAGGAVALNGAVDVGGKLASESSMFAAQAAVKTGGDASITTTAGNIDLAKAEIGGALALKSNRDVSLHGEVAARSIGIDAADAVAVNATTRAAAELSIKAGGAVALSGAVDVGSKLTSESSMFAAGAAVKTGGDASITTTAGSIDLAKAEIGGALALKSNRDVALHGEVAARSIGIDAADAVAVNATTRAAGELSIKAGGAVALSGAVDVGSKLTSESSMFAAQAAVKTGGDASIATTAGNIDLAKAEIGGALTLKSNKDASLHGDVDAKSLGIDAVAAVAIDAAAKVAGDASLQAGGAIALKGALGAGGTLASGSASFAATTGKLQVAGDASIAAKAGDVALTQAAIGGALKLEASGDLVFGTPNAETRRQKTEATGASTPTIAVGGDAAFDAGGAIALGAGETLDVKGRLASRSASFAAESGSRLKSGGDATITARTGRLALAQTDVGGALTLRAAESLTLDERIATTGALEVAAGAIVLNGSVRAGGATHIEAASLTMARGSALELADAGAIDVGGDAVIAKLDGAAALTLNAGGTLRLTDAVDIAGRARFAAGGAIDADLPALQLGAGSLVEAGTTLALRAPGELALAQLRSGGAMTLEAGGGLRLAERVQSGGDLALKAGGQVRVSDAVNVAGGARLEAGGWTMEAGSRVHAGGALSLRSDGDIALSSLRADGATLELTSGGRVQGVRDAGVHLGGASATRGSVSAALGIGDPLVTDLPWLSVTTKQGDIHLIVERDMYSPLLSAEQGKVELTVKGSLGFEHLLGNPQLWVDGRISGQRLTMREGSLHARQGVDIKQVNLVGGGKLAVAANEIALAVDGGAGKAELALGGFAGARADRIDVSVDNAVRAEIGQLLARNGSLSLPAAAELRNASVSETLRLKTPTISVAIDNLNPGARGADAQLITPRGQFWLQLDGARVSTDAFATRVNGKVQLSFNGQQALTLDGLLAQTQRAAELLQRPWAGWWSAPVAPLPFALDGWTLERLAQPGVAPVVNLERQRPLARERDEEPRTEPRGDGTQGEVVVGSLQP